MIRLKMLINLNDIKIPLDYDLVIFNKVRGIFSINMWLIYRKVISISYFFNLYDKVQYPILSETNKGLRNAQIDAIHAIASYATLDKTGSSIIVMPTGSGKTVIMAGLILYLYMQGYRKFLFFVNQTNIIEKTKENFLNPSSIKYLFVENIELMGESVEVKEVENFFYCDDNVINILFTSTQKLHLDMNFPRENNSAIDDFEDDKIVLIFDELHHINTMIKKLTKNEEADKKSWEYTVNRILGLIEIMLYLSLLRLRIFKTQMLETNI